MNDKPRTESQVYILPPDRSMQKKLGNTDIDKLLSEQAIQTAQQIIAHTSDQFLEDSLAEMKKLQQELNDLNHRPEGWQKILKEITNSAFAIKSQTALGGYDLISTIAKSLLTRCELLAESNLSPGNVAVLEWHAESLQRLLTLKVKGSGGPVGEAILAELKKLSAVQ